MVRIVARLPFIRFRFRRFGLRLLNSFPRYRGLICRARRLIALCGLRARGIESSAERIARSATCFSSSAVRFGLGLGNVINGLLTLGGKSRLSAALDAQFSRLFGDAHHVMRQSTIFLRVMAKV